MLLFNNRRTAMVEKIVNDMTDEFDARLKALQKGRAPKKEEDAAIVVYERVRTARAICQALLPKGFTESAVVSVAMELGREVHSGHGSL